MTTVRDIAKILATRHSLSGAEAEAFIQMMVETINEGLFRDRQVKIKGFGTFRLQTVKERTSVNVNTGEKVIIGEHDKVSFTPDNVMKDIINKPFAQFETVPVDDDSPLLDANNLLEMELEIEDGYDDDVRETEMHDDTPPENVTVAVPIQDTVTEQEQKDDTPRQEDTSLVEEEVVQTQEAKEESSSAEEIKKEDTEVEAKKETPCAENEEEDEECEECDLPGSRCRNIFIYYGVIINIVVAVTFFILGYLACSQQWFSSEEEETAQPVALTEKEKAIQTKKQDSIPATMPVQSSKEKTDTLRKAKAVKTVTETPKVEKIDNAPETLKGKDYDNDARVRTGAYNIIGTETEVVVKEGQTLKSISRTYLGDGMECYVEVYNDKKEVKAGDKIKIPKLKLKKAARKK